MRISSFGESLKRRRKHRAKEGWGELEREREVAVEEEEDRLDLLVSLDQVGCCDERALTAYEGKSGRRQASEVCFCCLIPI